jgi:hypothetical protein
VGPGNPIVAPSWWWLVPFLIPFPGNPAYGQVGEDVDHSQKPSKRLLTFEEFN